MGAKLLEESQELFRSWRKGDGEGILKESAEVLGIILAAIGIYGFKLEDLVAEREKRLRDRGGFLGMQFLEGVGESLPFVEGLEDVPRLILIRRACPPCCSFRLAPPAFTCLRNALAYQALFHPGCLCHGSLLLALDSNLTPGSCLSHIGTESRRNISATFHQRHSTASEYSG